MWILPGYGTSFHSVCLFGQVPEVPRNGKQLSRCHDGLHLLGGELVFRLIRGDNMRITMSLTPLLIAFLCSQSAAEWVFRPYFGTDVQGPQGKWSYGAPLGDSRLSLSIRSGEKSHVIEVSGRFLGGTVPFSSDVFVAQDTFRPVANELRDPLYAELQLTTFAEGMFRKVGVLDGSNMASIRGTSKAIKQGNFGDVGAVLQTSKTLAWNFKTKATNAQQTADMVWISPPPISKVFEVASGDLITHAIEATFSANTPASFPYSLAGAEDARYYSEISFLPQPISGCSDGSNSSTSEDGVDAVRTQTIPVGVPGGIVGPGEPLDVVLGSNASKFEFQLNNQGSIVGYEDDQENASTPLFDSLTIQNGAADVYAWDEKLKNFVFLQKVGPGIGVDFPTDGADRFILDNVEVLEDSNLMLGGLDFSLSFDSPGLANVSITPLDVPLLPMSVPEPSSAVVLVCGLLFVLRRFRLNHNRPVFLY